MKQKTKSIISIIFAIVLIIGSMPVTVLAFESDQNNSQNGSDNEFISGIVPEDIELSYPSESPAKRDSKKSFRSDSLPQSYDTREDYQTSVKNQGQNGICWTFGTYAALEANMRKNGMGIQDFSELHMAHCTSSSSVGPENGWTDRLPSQGGNRFKATSYLMRGGSFVGTVDEWDDPYTDIFKTIQPRDASISADKVRTYRAKNAIFLNGDIRGSEASDAVAIKKAIMKYGGVGASMYWNGNAVASEDPNTVDNGFFNKQTGAYRYINSLGTEENPSMTNHLVEIAGWDDDYPITNFNEVCRPDNPGAWLVKNSWGDDWGNYGYLWISYEDTNFPRDAFCFDGAVPYDYSKTTIYEYDKRIEATTTWTREIDTDSYLRVFEVNSDSEELTAAKIFIGAPCAITVDAVADLSIIESKNNPFNDEIPGSRGQIVAEYPGWYEIPLDNKLQLGEAGSKFGVVFTIDWDDSVSTQKRYLGVDTFNNSPSNTLYIYTGARWYASSTTNIAMKAITETTSKPKYEININGGIAYKDPELTAEITEAVAGERVYFKCNEPSEGKYISNITCSPGTSIIKSTLGTSHKFYVTMPEQDITINVVMADRSEFAVDLSSGSAQVPEAVFFNLPYLERTGKTLQEGQCIDINDDGNYDVEVLQRNASTGMVTVKKHDESDLGGSYEDIPDSKNTPYSKVTYQFGDAPSVIKIKSVRVNGFETPMVGNKASEHLNLSVPESSHYNIVEKKWQSFSSGSYLNPIDVFEADTMYSCWVYIVPKDGAEFASVEELEFYVNGDQSLINGVGFDEYDRAFIFTRYRKAIPNSHTHEWGDASYEWTKEGDDWKCTASRICTKDARHTETETVTANGEETQAATEDAEGVMTYTAAFVNTAFTTQTRTEPIPKLETKPKTDQEPKPVPETKPAPGSNPNQKGKDGTPTGKGASAAAANKAITSSASDEGPKGTKFAELKLRSSKQTNNSIILSWDRTKGATRYVVYGNACGKKNKMKKLTTLGNKKSFTVKKISKKLKKGTYHKFMVVALDKNNNVVSTSKVIHVATKGGKVTNPKTLSVKKGKKTVTKLSIKKGKTATVKSSVTKVSNKLTLKKHRVVIYESDNPKIATVGAKNGKLKGVRKGSCYIYAYAQNGLYKRIKVTVN